MNELTTATSKTWKQVYGTISHNNETIERVAALAASGLIEPEALYRILAAADRLTSAAMWTVVHMTYAHRVGLSGTPHRRSEEHTSELQSLMRISYAVFCLKKQKYNIIQ